MGNEDETNFESNKRMRTATRTAFTRLCSELEKIVTTEPIDIVAAEGRFNQVEQKAFALVELDIAVMRYLTSLSDATDLEKDMETADIYQTRYNLLKVTIHKLLEQNEKGAMRDGVSDHSVTLSGSSKIGKKNTLKLPRIELKKFNGDIWDWLPFWNQFQRIHQNENLDNIDKFYYLVQSMVPNSRSRQLVESYPLSGENYEKVIDSLKSRFGREDLLIEYYVRELLKLLLLNVQKKVNLAQIYDKLESKLKALDTLGVRSDACSAMLYPLVESCIPEETLRAWQRSNNHQTGSKLNDRLVELLAFIRKEVENEERISLAVSGFGFQTNNDKRKTSSPEQVTPPATAAGLLTHKNTQTMCVFCKAAHPTQECTKAKNMELNEKKTLLGKKGCCFRCLTYGHLAHKCRISVKCGDCARSHMTIMCPGKKQQTHIPLSSTDQVLGNHTGPLVFLQTLVVRLKGKSERNIRAIVDTGSQRSYIMKTTALEMGYEPLREEKIVHSLFSGKQTQPLVHNCYRVRASKLDGTYSCNFEALDQTVICGPITTPSFSKKWTTELEDLGIKISDQINGPIELLIGADIAGNIFTGKRHELKCGLVALETLLGWTLIGKVNNKEIKKMKTPSTTMTVTSLLSSQRCIADLCLGIKDPSEKKDIQEVELEVRKHFIDQSTSVMVDEEFYLRGWEFSYQNECDTHLETKVLGLISNKGEETLRISDECLNYEESDVVTKRKILSVAHRLYDPIGFTVPVSLYPKLIAQEIRRLSEVSRWFHVPGTANPADLPCRGCSSQALLSSFKILRDGGRVLPG